MGILDAPSTDWRSRPLSSFSPLRDLPGLLGHWDSSLIPESVGATLNAIPDASVRGLDLTRYTQTTAVATVAAAPNGRKVARTNGTGYFSSINWGAAASGKPAGITAPITILCVASATTSTPGADRVIVSTQPGSGGTLTSASTAGATSIQSSVSFTVAARVALEPGAANQEVADVAAVSGASSPYTVTFTAPLTKAHASGVAVTTTSMRLKLDSVGYSPQSSGNLGAAQQFGGGGTAPLNDGALHVYALVHGTSSASLFCDGVLVAESDLGTASTFGIVDLYYGANGVALPLDGDLAELVILGAALSPTDAVSASKSLASKWGVTIKGDGSKGSYYSRVDGTSGVSSQAYRILPPPKSAGAHPLVIWSHPHGHTQAISPSYFAWPLFKTLNSAGFGVAASLMHGDSWGNANAINDIVDLYNQYALYFGAPSKVILVGGSMGGLASALAIPDGRIPNIAGVIGVDAVFNLANMYANASYTASIKTAYGVAGDGSDYASKTSGHDPLLRVAADFGTVPFRFYSGLTDATVPTASHATPFAALLTGATEKVVIEHVGGHLDNHAIWAADALAFAQRCIA